MLQKGRYRVRLAEDTADVRATQALRHLAFIAASGACPSADGGNSADGANPADGLDRDEFDHRCQHVLIEEQSSGALVCCFRLMGLGAGSEISRSYSAQYYDLSRLQSYPGRMAELGRFCIHPDLRDPDILRLAWAALTRQVDQQGIGMLFGCSSFRGTHTRDYRETFAMLAARHLAPECWQPQVKSPQVVTFAAAPRHSADIRGAMLAMPPLLRSYLAMGGWVSDHAVVDTKLNTLHVFTGLEIRAIPPARARLLRAIAA